MQDSKPEILTIIRSNQRRWPLTLSDFWRWKEAFYRLLIRDFLVRFKGTYLGMLWILIQPLCFLVVLSIFAKKEDFENLNISTSNYILSGLVFWFFIANGFNQGAMSLQDNRSLITQTNIKRAIIPVCAVFSKLIDLVIGIIFLFFWVGINAPHALKITSPLILLDALGVFITLISMGWIFSILCIRFKDVKYMVPFISQLMFFATPLFYVASSEKLKWVAMLNPFAYFIQGARDHLFGLNLITTQNYLLGWLLCLTLFFISGLFFKKFERNIADIM